MFKFQKRDCVIGSIFVYVVLTMLWMLLQDRDTFSIPCYVDKTCIRFCCHNEKSCNENFIRKNFNLSFIDKFRSSEDYIILLGSPICKVNKISAKEFEKSWSFYNKFSSNLEVRKKITEKAF